MGCLGSNLCNYIHKILVTPSKISATVVMIKAFIFDLDGTLMDSEVLYVEAVQLVLQDKNLYISPEDAMSIVYGKAWPSVYAEVNMQFPGVFPTIESMEKPLREHFLRLRNSKDVRIKSSIELLRKLSQDFPVCIVSGSAGKDVEDSIALMGIESNLAFYLSCEDYAPGKPDPACYRLAADKLGVVAEQCLVFEDSTAGIQAAKQVGMYCIALKRRGAPEQDTSDADETLEDLADFLSLVKTRPFLKSVRL